MAHKDKQTPAEWRELATKESKGRSPDELNWETPEGIAVKPLYSEEDLKGLDHLGNLPGFAPFVRGPRATMYAGRPWTVRQYAGFSTANCAVRPETTSLLPTTGTRSAVGTWCVSPASTASRSAQSTQRPAAAAAPRAKSLRLAPPTCRSPGAVELLLFSSPSACLPPPNSELMTSSTLRR